MAEKVKLQQTIYDLCELNMQLQNEAISGIKYLTGMKCGSIEGLICIIFTYHIYYIVVERLMTMSNICGE